jgi:AcrR family transcriptional regulator
MTTMKGNAERIRKPQQGRSRATVDAILQATAQVMREEGAEALSTNRVAQVAGVSIGTLYQYFADKGALTDAIAETADAAFAVAMAEVMPMAMAAPIDQAVRMLLEATFAVRRRDPALVREVLRMWSRTSAARLQRVPPAVSQGVLAALEARKEELGIDDVERVAFVLITAIHAVLVSRVVDDRFDVERIEQDVIRLALGFLAPQTLTTRTATTTKATTTEANTKAGATSASTTSEKRPER